MSAAQELWQLEAELRETREELERTRQSLAEMTAVANRLELELARAKVQQLHDATTAWGKPPPGLRGLFSRPGS